MKKANLLYIIIFVMFISVFFCACNAVSTQQRLEKEGYFVKEEHEFSYNQPEGSIMGIMKSDKNAVVYISKGLPETEPGFIDSISNICSANNKIYTANNHIAVEHFNGKAKPIDLLYSAYYLAISGQKAIYINETRPAEIFIQDLRTGEVDIPVSDLYSVQLQKSGLNEYYNIPSGENAVLANDHMFYINKDEHLIRCTLSGMEKTTFAEGIVSNIKYLDGWVYFINKQTHNLCKVSDDGDKTEKVIDDVVDDYCFYGNEIYYQKSGRYLMHFNQDRQKLLFDLEGLSDSADLHLTGYINGSLYFSSYLGLQAFDTKNGEYQVVDRFADVYYKPVIIDDWAYYYRYTDDTRVTSNLIRVNIIKGKTEALGGSYERVIEYY